MVPCGSALLRSTPQCIIQVVEIGNLLRLYANHKRIGKLLVGCEVATFEARMISNLPGISKLKPS